MEPRKHRTPSGLPPTNFEEGGDVWNYVRKPENELELILTHGVWAPEVGRRVKRRVGASRQDSAQANQFFAANSPQLKPMQLIAWWEKRRIAYNGVLLGFGSLALCLLWVTTVSFRYKAAGLTDALSRGDTLLDPHALALLFLGANAIFTTAWLADLASRKLARQERHVLHSASLLHAAVWLSVAGIGLVAISLLHCAIAR